MKVLISGGSGLLGREITKQLIDGGHQVAWLSRSPRKEGKIERFEWDPDTGKLDPAAISFADAIINLAGASIAKPWTPHYKNEILRSRIDGTRLLHEAVSKSGKKLEAFISASASGYYPNDPEKVFTEQEAPGSDFLSLVCQKWEQEAMRFEDIGIRTVRLRIGIVLDPKEGALSKIAQPIKLGFGAPLGNGQQWMPWIHRNDLAGIFIHCLLSKLIPSGVYNACGPQPATNEELTQKTAQVLKRPLWLPPIPAFVLKLILGEMAATALSSNRCSAQKIVDAGYQFKYPQLEDALRELYLN
jgi:uncharacterized protein (TIGR01777 family)